MRPFVFDDVMHGLTADPTYTPTNQPPDTMSPKTSDGKNNWFNNNNSWVTEV